MIVRMHAFEPASRANGPGLRAVVWFQGCTLGCPGCFNPATHDPGGGYDAQTGEIVEQIRAARGIEGVTISGGEPLQQPAALADLVRRLRETPLSILVFSGHALDSIQETPQGPEILASIDVLVAGPYIQAQHCGKGLLGSTNQRIHLLTSRYRPSDFASIPSCEVILHRDGAITLSGIRPMTDPG